MTQSLVDIKIHSHHDAPHLAADLFAQAKKRFTPQDVGYFLTPEQPEISALPESEKLFLALGKHRPRIKNILFIGIGGSSLGPISLMEATQDYRDPAHAHAVYFIENPDPTEWHRVSSTILPEETVVVPVTKSGGTFETLSLFLLALEWLGKLPLTDHVIAITDPEKGDLRRLAKTLNLPSLPIHPSIGGRFSLTSPVGFFPALTSGISAAALNDGFLSAKNNAPAIFSAADLILAAQKTHPTHVFFPYSTRLKRFGDWATQLWGESLGKDGKGFTPISCLGANDQHSVMQLFRDGPKDKLFHFIQVKNETRRFTIPKLSLPEGAKKASDFPAFTRLEGLELKQLLTIEKDATLKVLVNTGAPVIEWTLQDTSPQSLGMLYFYWMMLTSIVGEGLGINAYDQPGVEEGKVYIEGAIARKG